MNHYLRKLAKKSSAVHRQIRHFYQKQDRLCPMNPYGRDFFAIPHTLNVEHMFPNVIAIKVTNACLGECAFCFRQKEMREELNEITVHEIDLTFNEYLPSYNSLQFSDETRIKEILITGGEPFLLRHELLNELLKKARRAGVQTIRIGSRALSVSPWLVDNELLQVLQQHLPLTVVIHINHVDELTPEAIQACLALQQIGISLKNQAVLLRGVNDSIEDLQKLTTKLQQIAIKPYRLNHCMPVGYQQLRTTVRKGIELIRDLRECNDSDDNFVFCVITPFGKTTDPGEEHILDQKLGIDLLSVRDHATSLFNDPQTYQDACFLKLRLTSPTTKDADLPKEVWYMDGCSDGATVSRAS